MLPSQNEGEQQRDHHLLVLELLHLLLMGVHLGLVLCLLPGQLQLCCLWGDTLAAETPQIQPQGPPSPQPTPTSCSFSCSLSWSRARCWARSGRPSSSRRRPAMSSTSREMPLKATVTSCTSCRYRGKS